MWIFVAWKENKRGKITLQKSVWSDFINDVIAKRNSLKSQGWHVTDVVESRRTDMSPGEYSLRNPYPPAGYKWRPLGKDERRVTHSGRPIPPAYTDVFINLDPEAKLEACARDSKGRPITTPFYKPSFRKSQDVAKFRRVDKWEPVYDKLMARIAKHFPKSEEAKVLYLIDKTWFRVGGEEGDIKAAVKAYGASTLLPEHADVEKDTVKFSFISKKGKKTEKIVKDPILAQLIRERKGRTRLFDTDAGKILSHLRSYPGAKEFKTHDFRTFHATKMAKELVAKMPFPETHAAFKRARNEVGEAVAEQLGDTRAVALGSYIDPRVFKAWEKALPPAPKKKKRKKK